ncbi:MAG: efflux RND transporter periplasmic adaptor subunit [Verrucomicrobiota bacterium]
MKTALPILILLVGSVACVVLFLLRKPPAEKEYEEIPRLVETMTAEVEDVVFEIETSGFVQARDQSTISASVSGPILSTSDRLYPGEFFEAGSELLQIDPIDFEVAVERAKANLASQQSLLAQEEARAEMALRDWERIGKVGTPSSLAVREPQLEEIRRSVAAAEAELLLARKNLERTTIRAPFDALVSEKLAEVGQFVGAGAELVTLLAIDYAEVRLPIDLEDLPFLELEPINSGLAGPEVILRSGGSERRGYIVRSENVVDEATRSFFAVARLEDPYLRNSDVQQPNIAVGQFVEGFLQSRVVPRVSRLPRLALRGRDEIVLVGDESRLEIREVEVVYDTRNEIFVRGIEEGETIVLTTPARALPGERVTIKTVDPPLELGTAP